jgi:hypothetical protein
MAVNSTVSRSAHQQILAHLRTLRVSLEQARGALMHFKDDRVDRDKLEPAARRVDDLMNMFATGLRDPAKGLVWMNTIQGDVEQVVNPKSAAALRDAGVEIAALLTLMTAVGKEVPPVLPQA